MAVRIIGGRLGGRLLSVPGGFDVRPTPERVRESLFSALGELWEGRHVLDLFAGSGCLAFESLSRGAAHATLVDRDGKVVRALRESAAALGVEDAVTIVRAESDKALRRFARDGAAGGGPRFDAVWLDPPYASDLLGRALVALPAILRPGAVVVAEHPSRAVLPDEPAPGLSVADRRRYGDTAVTIYRVDSADGNPGSQGQGQVQDEEEPG